jgi:hypothetical protein
VDAVWYQLLRRFFRAPSRMSRNRNFHSFLDARVRYAAHIGRLLRSLRADLLERDLETVRLTPGEPVQGEQRHVLELSWPGGRRRSVLTAAELAIFLEDEEVERVLGDLERLEREFDRQAG